MSPEVSRRIGAILGTHPASYDERGQIAAGSMNANQWSDIPAATRALLAQIEQRSQTARVRG